MNLHLLRSPELKQETYRNVLHLLQQFRGPINFLACEDEILEYTEDDEVEWLNKKDFETSKEMKVNYSFMLKSPSMIEFPYREKVKTWKELFAECDKYRKLKGVPDADLVVLLTDVSNELNWFGSASPSMKNYFIQTSNWGYFFGASIDIRFPIAYEVIIWAMRYFMFSSSQELLKSIHKEPIGCIMDFCQDKPQIILKMRTADVCEDCMNIFIDRDVPKLYVRQFFDILDGIRETMTFRGRSKLLHKPSRIEIRGYTKRIFFTELGNLELRLNPKEKTVYFLFLNHPEGIHLSGLADHQEELSKLYSRFSNLTNPDSLVNAIALLVDPLDNDINIILSRINRKIKDAVGESLLDFYSIKGERGEPKRIKLDRELVVGMEG